MTRSPDHAFLSAELLRGIAHPLRVRLLNMLRDSGPSTATRLAEQLSQSSGATSYHLRQLALYGFVEEDPGHDSGRERWWRAVHRGSSLEAEQIRESPVEAEAYMRSVAAEYAARVDRWLNEMHRLPETWDQAATLSDFRFRLTAAEATDLLADLEAVLRRYRKDLPEIPAPDGAARVVIQLAQLPFLDSESDR
jgi:DNA-binding transcriptional ArsR family regulator